MHTIIAYFQNSRYNYYRRCYDMTNLKITCKPYIIGTNKAITHETSIHLCDVQITQHYDEITIACKNPITHEMAHHMIDTLNPHYKPQPNQQHMLYNTIEIDNIHINQKRISHYPRIGVHMKPVNDHYQCTLYIPIYQLKTAHTTPYKRLYT